MSRLLVAWLALSFVIGGVVYFTEMKKVDSFIIDLALSESAVFDTQVADTISALEAGAMSSLQAKADALTARHFSVVELYGQDREHLLISARHEGMGIEAEIEKYHHKFPMNDTVHHENYRIDNAFFAQVLIPLVNSQGEISGYFDGVYRVEQSTFEQIRRRVYQVLFLVLASVFVCFLVLYPLIISLNRELFKYFNDLLKANVQLLEVLGGAIAVRDTTTSEHNYRVTFYAVKLGEAIGLNSDQIRNLMAGSFLHDVGKIGVHDAILRKNGALSTEETQHMRRHVTLGVDIASKANWSRAALDVIEFHHEKYDGSGYAQGLKGEHIPLNARIFAVVDVFDALTSRRPYKRAYDFDTAIQMLMQEKGRHFDPLILENFTAIARNLYGMIKTANRKQLESMLNELENRYFFLR